MFLIPTVALTIDPNVKHEIGEIETRFIRTRFTVDIDKVSTYAEGENGTTILGMDNGATFIIEYDFMALMKELAEAEDWWKSTLR